MPAGDGTGPGGLGPRAGRGTGLCKPGAGTCRQRLGFGAGRGGRISSVRGVSRRDQGAGTGEVQGGARAVSVDELKMRAKGMEESLHAVRSRIAEIEGEALKPFEEPA